MQWQAMHMCHRLKKSYACVAFLKATAYYVPLNKKSCKSGTANPIFQVPAAPNQLPTCQCVAPSWSFTSTLAVIIVWCYSNHTTVTMNQGRERKISSTNVYLILLLSADQQLCSTETTSGSKLSHHALSWKGNPSRSIQRQDNI